MGLFGTSIAGTWLATEAEDAVAFFVDEDMSRRGRPHLGKPVYAPTEAPSGSQVFLGLPPELAAAIRKRLANLDLNLIMPR